jgi:hypothetical protein
MFEQISRCAQPGCFLNVGVITMGGEDDNSGERKVFENDPGGVQPIQQRHGNFHQDYGWAEFSGQFHRLPHVFWFAADLDDRLGR